MPANNTKPGLILMDVYETLIDMGPLARKVNSLLGSKRGYSLWFELLVQYCCVDNCTDKFHDFLSIAKATLQMTAHHLKEKIKDSDIEHALGMFRYLPVHEDVQSSLSKLRDQDFRIAALTNIPADIVHDRMETTGLISYFDKVLSCEEVRKYKPARETYLWAAGKLNTAPADILMVTSHGWDIAGADNAGMNTAYKMQDRYKLYSLSNTPGMEVKNLSDLVKRLSS